VRTSSYKVISAGDLPCYLKPCVAERVAVCVVSTWILGDDTIATQPDSNKHGCALNLSWPTNPLSGLESTPDGRKPLRRKDKQGRLFCAANRRIDRRVKRCCISVWLRDVQILSDVDVDATAVNGLGKTDD